MSKFSKDEIIQAIKELWIEEYGDLNDDNTDHRTGYFVVGFVSAAIERLKNDES